MTESQNTRSSNQFLDEIENDTGRKFKHPAHIHFLFTASDDKKMADDLRKILFSSKYVNGLKKIVSQGSLTDDKYKNKIFEEFNTNVQNLIELLDRFSVQSEGNDSLEFRKEFLGMDHASLARVLELAEDLSSCKEFFNRNEDRFPGFKFTPAK